MKFLNILILVLVTTLVNCKVIDKIQATIDALTEFNYQKNSKFVYDNLLNGFNNLKNEVTEKIGVNTEATENALSYMKGSETVKVSEFDNYYFFDGPGKEKAFIFYQGAMVDEKAYAEIMFKLAENGLDCFLMRMPYRLAFNDIHMADRVIKNYRKNYKEFYIGGHSLGGSIAAVYAYERKNEIKGIALMAAFSMFKLPDTMKAVSLIATNDKVLVWPLYNYYLKKLPKDYTEVKIEGGNHGHFGDYGEQFGDGEATISLQKQHDIIIDSILQKFGL